jgi:ech hydrogenase subunit F
MAQWNISRMVAASAFSAPATRLYPYSRRAPFAATRGHVRFVHDTCVFCNLCAKVCPTDAIVVNRKEKRWVIDRRKCILCGVCVESCRKDCLFLENSPAPSMTAAEWERMRVETEVLPPAVMPTAPA